MNYHLIHFLIIILAVNGEKPKYIIETEDGVLHAFPEKLAPVDFKSVHLHQTRTKSKLI